LRFTLVWKETLLPVEQLLCWDVDRLRGTVLDRNLRALLPADGLTIRSSLCGAVGGTFHDTVERVGHPGVCDLLRLVIPQLLLRFTFDLRNDELDILGDKLTLLPCDGLTRVCTRPDLFSIGVSFPKCDTVLLGYVPTLGEQLGVWDCLLASGAALLNKLLGLELGLSVLLGNLGRLALLVWNHLTMSLGNILTDIL